MIKLYRILTVLINCFFVFGIFVTIYEALVGGYSDTEGSLIFSVLIIYVVLSSTYFVWKTRKVSKRSISLETLGSDIVTLLQVDHFRFAYFFAVSNIVIGLLIISASIFVLIFYPISFFVIEELFRLHVLIFGVFYGALKIYYSNFMLKRVYGKSNKT